MASFGQIFEGVFKNFSLKGIFQNTPPIRVAWISVIKA